MAALESKPALNEIEGFYYNAFSYLGLGRSNGMGLGAVPLSDIVYSPEFCFCE